MAHDVEDEFQDENLPPTRPVREPRLRRPPFWMVSALIILLVGTWLPLAFFARARAATSEEPRVQLVYDMGKQPKYREQMSNAVFADGRADRMPVDDSAIYNPSAGKDRAGDEHFELGYTMVADPATGQKSAKFYDTFPDRITVDDTLIHRGQQRFNIYCVPCHGLDGSGNGLVNLKAQELKEPLWVSPVNLHDATYRGRPVGHIFNTISVGIRNMPPYGAQIPPEDRWAIVAYVRALQLSQNAAPSMLTPQLQQELK